MEYDRITLGRLAKEQGKAGAGIASGPGKSQRRIVFAPVPGAVCEADHDPRRVFFQTFV